MAMQFNADKALLRGMDLGSPSSSQSGINNLLNMQQGTVNDLINSIGNIGKTSRTNTVNDLIARGGLEGLNEAQTQAKLLQTAGGTLTPEAQMQMEKLLMQKRVGDERAFTNDQRIGRQEFDTTQQQNLFGQQTSERLGRQEFDAGQNKIERDFKANESVMDRENRLMLEKLGITSNEKIAGERNKLEREKMNLEHQDAVENRNLKKLIETEKNVPKAEKLTGGVEELWKNASGKGKKAIEQMYQTGELSAKPIMIKDANGIDRVGGYTMMYQGQETNINELKQFFGANDSAPKIKKK